MKSSLKKILFIIVCAELMIWYWASIEVRESNREIVYQKNMNEKIKPS
jgi:hypothetical protein